MTLYSWFLRTSTKQNNKNTIDNNNLIKASESVKSIKSYTMWPTATIKQNVEIILPTFKKLDDKLPKHQPAILPAKVVLAVIKS